jgi:cation diffusion facilitator family transporter
LKLIKVILICSRGKPQQFTTFKGPMPASEKITIRSARFSIISNGLLAIIKWLAGFFGNSYALIADAIESTSDVFSSILLLFGLKISHKPADENHPYGHGRAEPLLTFGVVAFLVISAAIIAWQSIEHLLIPHELPKVYTLVILGVIIAWKEISYRIVLHRSKASGSTVLKADAWHHRSDAITSVAAFIGISVALYFGKGYESADDWAALIACVVILINSYLLFKQALGEIMDEQLYEDMVKQIREISMDVPGVSGTEKCFIRKSGIYYLADLHVRVNGSISVTEGHEIAHRLKDKLQAEIPQLAQVLIHVEPQE